MRSAPPERLAAFRILTGLFGVGFLLVRLPYFLDVTRLDPSRWDPPGVLAPLRSPEDSLRSIRVPAGFTVELVASEPLVKDPIAFDWGEK